MQMRCRTYYAKLHCSCISIDALNVDFFFFFIIFPFLRDDDDINDVASMAGVNLSEESARILATNSELVGTLTRSCKDEAFLFSAPLQRRILEIGMLALASLTFTNTQLSLGLSFNTNVFKRSEICQNSHFKYWCLLTFTNNY